MVDRRRLNNGPRRRSRSPGRDRTRHRSRDRHNDFYDRDDRRYRDRSREKSRYHENDRHESRYRDRQRSRERSPDQYRDRKRGDRDSMRSGDRFQDRPSERSGGRYSIGGPSNQHSPPSSDRFSGSFGYSRRSSREQSPARRDREMPHSSMHRDRSRTPPPRSFFDSSRRIPSPSSPPRNKDDMKLNHASSVTASENHGASDQKKPSATLWGQNQGW